MTKKLEEEIQFLKDQVDNHERRISTLETSVNLKPVDRIDRISINELRKKYKPKNGNQIVLAVGYYLQYIEEVVPFNKKDMELIYNSGKIVKPKNINDSVNKIIQQALMEENRETKDDLKSWHLTSSGRRFVENGFVKTNKD